MDIPESRVGHYYPRFCCPWLLAALSLLSGYFHLVYCNRDGYGDQAGCSLAAPPRTLADSRNHARLSPACRSADWLYVVVISVDCRAGYNDCRRISKILSKPA